MKNLFFIILVLSFIAIPANSQTQLGITGGINFSNFYGADISGSQTKTGFDVGVFTTSTFEQFSIMPAILYSNKGTKKSVIGLKNGVKTSYDYTLDYNYLEFPVMGMYVFDVSGNISPFLIAGPFVGYLLNSNLHTKKTALAVTVESDAKNENQYSLNFGIAFGGGISFDVNNNTFSLTCKYSYGLLKVNASDVKTSCFSIMAGLTF